MRCCPGGAIVAQTRTREEINEDGRSMNGLGFRVSTASIARMTAPRQIVTVAEAVAVLATAAVASAVAGTVAVAVAVPVEAALTVPVAVGVVVAAATHKDIRKHSI